MAAGRHTHAVNATNNGHEGWYECAGRRSDASASGYASEGGSSGLEHLQFGRARRSRWARSHRRRAGAREPHAVPRPELLHRASGHFSVAQLRRLRPDPRSIEDDLIVLMIARRRVDGNEVEVKARAPLECDAVHALRRDRRGRAAQQRLKEAAGCRGFVPFDRRQRQRRPVDAPTPPCRYAA